MSWSLPTSVNICFSIHSISLFKYLFCCSLYPSNGARCSSMVRAFAHGVLGRLIDGGPIELFLVPRLVYQMPWYVPSCLRDGAYKRTLAANRKE